MINNKKITSVQNTGEVASSYQKVTLTGQYLLAATAIRKELSQLEKPINTLLDYGCGKSLWPSVPFIEKGGRAIGVDLSEDQLSLACQNSMSIIEDHTSLSLDFHQVVNERSIPQVASNSVDIAQTSIVLQEIRTEEIMQAILIELYRVLKMTGYFFASCVGDKIINEDYTSFTYKGFPENAEEGSVFRKTRSIEGDFIWDNDRHWTKKELKLFAVEAGFSSITFRDIFADPALPPFPSQAWKPWKDELVTPSVFLMIAKK